MPTKALQTIAHALVLVALMLGLIAAALWLRPGPLEAQAQAQVRGAATDTGGVPDAGRQRQMMVEQLSAISGRLAEIEKALRDGAFIVQVTEPKSKEKDATK